RVTAAVILAAEVSGLAFSIYWAALLGYPLLIASGLLLGRNRGVFRVQAEQLAALLAQRERLEGERRPALAAGSSGGRAAPGRRARRAHEDRAGDPRRPRALHRRARHPDTGRPLGA